MYLVGLFNDYAYFSIHINYLNTKIIKIHKKNIILKAAIKESHETIHP